MIAQIDEQQAAVVTHTVHPAGEANGFADLARAQGAACVASVNMHEAIPPAIDRAGQAHANLVLSSMRRAATARVCMGDARAPAIARLLGPLLFRPMRKILVPLIPLLLAAGMLLGGNGLQATVLSLRAAQEGFSTTAIGLLGTGYFAGYIVGCFVNPWLVRQVGHIRVFAALAALVAAGTLGFVLWVHPAWWVGIRLTNGFCFAGLFAVMESWLNAASLNENRARVFSIYRVVDLTCVASGQFLMPLLGVGGFLVFTAMAILTCLSVIPVALFDRSNPLVPETFYVNPRKIWTISPIARSAASPSASPTPASG